MRSFDGLPHNATVDEFIDDLVNVLVIEDRRAGSPSNGATSHSSLPDRMHKQQLMQSLGRLPKSATVDDVAYRLNVILKGEKGMATGTAGHKVTQQEARQRPKHWFGGGP